MKERQLGTDLFCNKTNSPPLTLKKRQKIPFFLFDAYYIIDSILNTIQEVYIICMTIAVRKPNVV